MHSRDRSHGQALPSVFDDAAMLRMAHGVWGLRPNDEGEGSVIVRKREEQSVDTRAAQVAPIVMPGAETEDAPEEGAFGIPSTSDDLAEQMNPQTPPGTIVGFMVAGQVAPGVVVIVNQGEQSADLEMDDGCRMNDVPLDQLLPPPELEAPPDMGPMAVQAASFDAEFTIGQSLMADAGFKPVLMGGRVEIAQGEELEVAGASKPDAQSDEMFHEISNPLYPPEGTENIIPWMRIRVLKNDSPDTIFITGAEYAQYVSVVDSQVQDDSEPPMQMPGIPVQDHMDGQEETNITPVVTRIERPAA